MTQRKTLRGVVLDEAIDTLLAQMISLGFEVAPILQTNNAALVKQRDSLYEALTVIAQRCLLKGLDLEDMMAPLREKINY